MYFTNHCEQSGKRSDIKYIRKMMIFLTRVILMVEVLSRLWYHNGKRSAFLFKPEECNSQKILDNAIEGIPCNLVLHTLLHCVHRPVFSSLFLSCVYTELLKRPKLEIFVAGIFAQTRPIWIVDLGTRPKKSLKNTFGTFDLPLFCSSAVG